MRELGFTAGWQAPQFPRQETSSVDKDTDLSRTRARLAILVNQCPFKGGTIDGKLWLIRLFARENAWDGVNQVIEASRPYLVSCGRDDAVELVAQMGPALEAARQRGEIPPKSRVIWSKPGT